MGRRAGHQKETDGIMKIPSEAELIEMERRTLCLPDIIAYLERRADVIGQKIAIADAYDDERKLTPELDRLERAIENLRRLEITVDALVALAREGSRVVVQNAR